MLTKIEDTAVGTRTVTFHRCNQVVDPTILVAQVHMAVSAIFAAGVTTRTSKSVLWANGITLELLIGPRSRLKTLLVDIPGYKLCLNPNEVKCSSQQ